MLIYCITEYVIAYVLYDWDVGPVNYDVSEQNMLKFLNHQDFVYFLME